jgi:hypothetical protein
MESIWQLVCVMFLKNQPRACGRGRAGRATLTFLVLLCLAAPVMAAGSKSLPGHVPAVVAHLSAIGTLPATNRLDLAIGLPLRHQAELSAFLNRLYDPASLNYHHYLTPAQFTEQFGPTARDYAAVEAFARQNNLAIRATHSNRLVLDVNGAVADIEHSLHVKLKVYHHPTEARDFYAPDTDPSVDENMPIADVSGLNNLCLPQPRVRIITSSAKEGRATPKTGSGPAGSFLGNDFRAAYLSGVTLTGTGQTVGLLEFSGYYANDITTYETKAGLGAVSLINVDVGNYNGQPTSSGNVEASLDIEMTLSMAPGLSKIVVFDAGPTGNQNDILEAMAADNSISQFSCSWGWGGGPTNTTDSLFQEMMTQGQSFFNAAGDSDAFTIGNTSANGVDNPSLGNAPSSDPYITQVGGTSLVTTGPGGAWSSETVWNWGAVEAGRGQQDYVGTSGGVSSYYAIPSWQANVSMSANGGSTYFRNIPDVAANAENAYITFNNGSSSTNEGGTSFAAPLWAGLAALMNEQAANTGRPAVGFINPVIYALGRSISYTTIFHDITSGNNEWSGSPNNYTAVAGYDLCSGWGTPNGQSLINAVADFEPLTVSQTNGFATTGYVGGPFNTNSTVFTLNNIGASTLNWSVGNLPTWLTATPASGTLAGHASASVLIGINTAALALPAGTYPATISITDLTTGNGKSFSFGLQALEALALLTTNGFTASGQVGGPFNVTATSIILTNLGTAPVSWTLGAHPSWLTVTPTNGTVAANHDTVVTATLNSAATVLAGGVYTVALLFNDVAERTGPTFPIILQVGQSIVQNGGFETGTLTNWVLVGTPNTASLTYNGVVSTSQDSAAVHSGTYGAFLGDLQLATLSQNLATVPGQTYRLSLWLDNPTSGAGEQFLVNWITNSATASRVYFVTNPPVLAWTNLSFILPATGTNTELQLGAENVPNFFGLDDISVIPIPNPAIDGLTRSGNSLKMTLYTAIGVNYELLYATNLAQPTWLPVSTNTATATTLTITNSQPGFYRIRQLP